MPGPSVQVQSPAVGPGDQIIGCASVKAHLRHNPTPSEESLESYGARLKALTVSWFELLAVISLHLSSGHLGIDPESSGLDLRKSYLETFG